MPALNKGGMMEKWRTENGEGYTVHGPDSDAEITIEVCCDCDGNANVYLTKSEVERMLKMFDKEE